MKMVSSHLSFQKLNFSMKGIGGDPLEGIPSNRMEARNQMKMVSPHLSVQKLSFSMKGRGGDPLEGIPSNQMEARNQMKMVSPHLSVQKLIFFKERESRAPTRRDSIQPRLMQEIRWSW